MGSFCSALGAKKMVVMVKPEEKTLEQPAAGQTVTFLNFPPHCPTASGVLTGRVHAECSLCKLTICAKTVTKNKTKHGMIR